MHSNSWLKQTRRSVRILELSLSCLICINSLAQTSPVPPDAPVPMPADQCGLSTPGRCAAQIARDQAGILTSPSRIRKKDLLWIAPFAAASGVAFAFDKKTLDQVSTDPARVSAFRRASNITGIYTPLAGIGATWLMGTIKHDDHLRETGLLAGEALADTMLFTSVLKFGTDRVRPSATGVKGESGEFWPDGRHYSGGDSFPSGHTAIAFAFAHVVADEYPGWKTKLAVYSLAAATAAERVGGREHFPSDVLVGGAIGYLIGGYVYDHHSHHSKNRIGFVPLVGGKTLGFSLSFARSDDDSSTSSSLR